MLLLSEIELKLIGDVHIFVNGQVHTRKCYRPNAPHGSPLVRCSARLRPIDMIHSINELSKHLRLLLVEMTTYIFSWDTHCRPKIYLVQFRREENANFRPEFFPPGPRSIESVAQQSSKMRKFLFGRFSFSCVVVVVVVEWRYRVGHCRVMDGKCENNVLTFKFDRSVPRATRAHKRNIRLCDVTDIVVNTLSFN